MKVGERLRLRFEKLRGKGDAKIEQVRTRERGFRFWVLCDNVIIA